MLNKSLRCTENCKTCSQLWSTERAQFFTSPNWCHTTNTWKVEWIWLWSFASSVILSPTNYYFKHLDNFMQGKPFHNQQEAENAFQQFIEFWSTNFFATGINKHFLLYKMHWLCWFLFWLIKMFLSLLIKILNSWSETAIMFAPTHNNSWEVNVPAVLITRGEGSKKDMRPEKELRLNHCFLGHFKDFGFYSEGDKSLDGFQPTQHMTNLHNCSCSYKNRL